MVHIKHTEAPVAFCTRAQQLECARWLRAEHGHSAGYIARLFNIMRSAFIDATQIKLRPVVVGDLVEAATPRAVSARQNLFLSGRLCLSAWREGVQEQRCDCRRRVIGCTRPVDYREITPPGTSQSHLLCAARLNLTVHIRYWSQ